jgi:hypothetical protein
MKMAGVTLLVRFCDFLDALLYFLYLSLSPSSSLFVSQIYCFLLCVQVNHWCACFWIMLHNGLESQGHAKTWAIVDGLTRPDVTRSDIYMRAFYFVITALSTVGYGDIRPYANVETVFQLIVILTGACCFAGSIGSITMYFAHMDETGLGAYKSKMARIKHYMKYRQVGLQFLLSIFMCIDAIGVKWCML